MCLSFVFKSCMPLKIIAQSNQISVSIGENNVSYVLEKLKQEKHSFKFPLKISLNRPINAQIMCIIKKT